MRDRKLQSGFDTKGLSLIDVSSEDDCLIDSPLIDQFSDGKLEVDETRGNERLKLHKSVTWDSSFFCSAGFLESEKLSSREDVNRSCDSSTVSFGEISRREGLKADFNEDRRASIHKSKRVPGNAGSSVKKELETRDSRIVSSSKLEYSNQDEVKQKAAPKKPNMVKDPGKTMKKVPARPQTSQSVGRSGISTSSLHKTPKILGKGASLGAKYIKIEKDAKSVTGRGTTISKTPALDGSRNTVPRTTLSSRSSSLSSSMIYVSSMDMIKQNNDSSLVNLSSSGYTTTNASNSAAAGKSRAGPSALSTLLKSPIKFHSSMSVASSYGKWSSELSFSSSTSIANKRSKVERATLGSDSHKGLVADSDAQQGSDSWSHQTCRPSLGNGAEVTGSLDESKRTVSDGSTGFHPAATKTSSGLRPPSTKLAFSNGVQSRHSRTRSVPSHPRAPIKTGAKITNPSGGSNKAPPRTLQQSTSAATKVRSASRNSKISHGISPKLQNKPSRKTGRESYSKAQGIGSAEKICGSDLPRLVVKLGGKDDSRVKGTKVVSLAVPDY